MGTLGTLFASQTPAPNCIPISDGSGTLNAWVTDGSGGGGDIQAMLDSISNVQGTILFRGASQWEALAPSVEGAVLTSHGAGANPTWEGGSTLYNDLIEWWPLDESSGARAGAFAGLDLSDHNGVSGTTGVNSSLASKFVRASSQWLDHAQTSALDNNGAFGFEFCFWVRADSLASNSFVISKDAVIAGPNRQYTIAILTSGALYCEVHETTGTTPISFASTLILTASTWYMVNMWYDTADKKARFALNHGTPQASSALSGTLNTTGSHAFELGAKTADPNYSNISLNKVGFWNRVLTAAERTALYNSGNGISFPF